MPDWQRRGGSRILGCEVDFVSLCKSNANLLKFPFGLLSHYQTEIL